MAFKTSVIALSAKAAQKFRSPAPYVIVQVTDPRTKHPYIHDHSGLQATIGFHFDDILPVASADIHGFSSYIPMDVQQAERIARFVKAWWEKVETIIVHCHAGISRSVGIALAIREFYGQNADALHTEPKRYNRHCYELMTEALRHG